jgi:hypothetical protein
MAEPAVPNRAAIADAGPDQQIAVGDAISLDGSGSSDPDGDHLEYWWRLTEGNLGTAFIGREGARRGKETGYPDDLNIAEFPDGVQCPCRLVFTLTVIDRFKAEDSDDVVITVD